MAAVSDSIIAGIFNANSYWKPAIYNSSQTASWRCRVASKGKNGDASMKSDRWKFLDEGKLRKVSNRLFTDPASADWCVLSIPTKP